MEFFDTGGPVAHRLSAHAQVKDSMIGLLSKLRSVLARTLFSHKTAGIQSRMGNFFTRTHVSRRDKCFESPALWSGVTAAAAGQHSAVLATSGLWRHPMHAGLWPVGQWAGHR